MNYDKLPEALEVALSAVQEAGDMLRPHFGNVEPLVKSNSGLETRDIVTKLDRETESFLSQRLRAFDASIGFRGEEHGVEHEQPLTWLVDPIDGTAHFVRGVPFSTVMVSLVHEGEVLLGVIHNIATNDMFWATKNGGSFKNGEPIRVSNRSLQKAFISFESDLTKAENAKLQAQLLQQGATLVSTVNCGYEFSMIASGVWEAKITREPYGFDWDYAPGSLLVSEAGGIVRNHGVDTFDFRNHELYIGNPATYDSLHDTAIIEAKN